MDRDKLIKLGSQKKDENKDLQKGIAGAGLGAYGISKAAPKFTGREKLYHGTAPEYAKDIRKKGLLSKFTGQKGSNTEGLKGTQQFDDSLGKVFLSRKKGDAKNYVAQTRMGGIANAKVDPEGFAKKRFLEPKEMKKGLVKAKVPTWKMNTIENPEVGNQTYQQWRKATDPLGIRSAKEKKKIYKGLKHNTVTIDGDLPTNYIKGSKNYKKNSLGEIKEYASKNPKKFALGTGLGLAGIGATAYGGKKIYDHFKNKREEKKEKVAHLGYIKLGQMKTEVPSGPNNKNMNIKSYQQLNDNRPNKPNKLRENHTPKIGNSQVGYGGVTNKRSDLNAQKLRKRNNN